MADTNQNFSDTDVELDGDIHEQFFGHEHVTVIEPTGDCSTSICGSCGRTVT